MSVIAEINELGILVATVTVEKITSGVNEGCVRIRVKNDSSHDIFIGSLCLTLNRMGPFKQISGPGENGELSGGNCPGGCLPDSDIVQKFTSQSERIKPGETGVFIICTNDPENDPLEETDFLKVGLHFQNIPILNSRCVAANFGPIVTTTTTTTATTTTTTTTTTTETTTTVCPVPNPQTCCQAIVEFKTQLVPPELASGDLTTRVFFASEPVIEQVCPEKVIVCGKLIKEITYIAVEEDGNQFENVLTDERSFHCHIDRDDANEGDEFDVVGYAVLCEGTPKVQNSGTRLNPTGSGVVDVHWRLFEKDIVKICIRKRTEIG